MVLSLTACPQVPIVKAEGNLDLTAMKFVYVVVIQDIHISPRDTREPEARGCRRICRKALLGRDGGSNTGIAQRKEYRTWH